MVTKTSKQTLILPADAIPGALLLAMAVLAMILVNSPMGPGFKALLDASFVIGPADGPIDIKISSWIKNALMAVFFFFVGLELRREMLEGQLSEPKVAALPALAAVVGLAILAASLPLTAQQMPVDEGLTAPFIKVEPMFAARDRDP